MSTTTNIRRRRITKSLKGAIRQPYTFPGMYALFTVCNDGGTLCMECTRKNWRGIAHDTLKGCSTGWDAAGVDALCNGDGPVICDNCSAEIA